jgi:hypothetical protein
MRYLGVENQLTQPVYDTMQLAAAAGQTVSFFSVPLNGVLAGAALKTYAHTNLVQAGRLEKGLELTIRGITLFVRDTASGGARVTLADYLAIYDTGHINLLMGQVSFLRIPAYLLPPGGAEVNYFSNIAAAATEYKATHGLGSFMNRFVLDSPLVLEEQESIQVDLFVGGTPAAVTDVSIVLWGDMLRPVR